MKSYKNICSTIFLLLFLKADLYGGLIWSGWNGIGIFNPSSGMNQLLAPDFTSGGLDVDLSTGNIYFFNNQTDQLKRINASDSSVDIIASYPAQSQGIALSSAGEIFTTSVLSFILKTNISTGATGIIMRGTDGLNVPEEIEVDSVNGYIYWTDRNSGSIKRATTNGANVTTLVSGLPFPHGLALDSNAGKLYFSNSDGLYSAETSGSNVQLLAADFNGLGLDVSPDGEWIGWADPFMDEIGLIRVDGSDYQVLATEGMENPITVAFLIPEPKTALLLLMSGIFILVYRKSSVASARSYDFRHR
jgi:DNA-binding beta-propeller fold protein YncE